MTTNTNEPETDKDYIRKLTYIIAGCFCFFVLSVTSCTVHMNTYNEDEAKTDQTAVEAEAKLKMEYNQQNHLAEMERINAIKQLVEETNANPVAARCAIADWSEFSNSEITLCETAARVVPIIVNSPSKEATDNGY